MQAQIEAITADTIHAAVDILGSQEYHPDKQADIECHIRALVRNDMTMRRLVDVIPEAFGLVIISHIGAASGVKLPTCFYAKDASEVWQSFPFSREPVFGIAIRISQHIFHNGPRHIIRHVANRSGLLATVSKALDTGACLDGSVLEGPKFFGLPAFLYEGP